MKSGCLLSELNEVRNGAAEHGKHTKFMGSRVSKDGRMCQGASLKEGCRSGMMLGDRGADGIISL